MIKISSIILLSVKVLELNALNKEKLIVDKGLNSSKSVLPIAILAGALVVKEHITRVNLEDALTKSKEYQRAYDIVDDECECGKP